MERDTLLVAFDTSVLVAASHSRNGASFALVSSIPSPKFQPALSVGLYAEWQSVLTRPENLPAGTTPEEAMAFLRYIAGHSHLQKIHFLWRPYLPDPHDDLVLELAFAARCSYVVRDFAGSDRLSVQAVTPSAFLNIIRAV